MLLLCRSEMTHLVYHLYDYFHRVGSFPDLIQAVLTSSAATVQLRFNYFDYKHLQWIGSRCCEAYKKVCLVTLYFFPAKQLM